MADLLTYSEKFSFDFLHYIFERKVKRSGKNRFSPKIINFEGVYHIEIGKLRIFRPPSPVFFFDKLSNKKDRSKKSFVFLELETKSEKLSNGRFEVFVNVTLVWDFVIMTNFDEL